MTKPIEATPQSRPHTSAQHVLVVLARAYDSAPENPPYVGCDDMPPSEYSSQTSERQWRALLRELACEGVKGLEVEADDTSVVFHARRRVRLTPEGAGEAVGVLCRWNASNLSRVRLGIGDALAACTWLARDLELTEAKPATGLIEHGEAMSHDVRHLLAMLESQDEAVFLSGDPRSTLEIGDTLALWQRVTAKAAHHSTAIMDALARKESELEPSSAAYALQCLTLAAALGVDVGAA